VTIGAGLAAIAGVSYQIYNASNPPKSPKQATKALQQSNQKLSKLQAKLAAETNPQKKTKIQDAVTKLQESISFLTTWISQNGDGPAPTSAEKEFAQITNPLGKPSTNSSGAVEPATPINWNLFAMLGAALGLVFFLGWFLFHRKRKN